MKNLAPNITRERLLIEGFFSAKIDKKFIENYFKKITQELNLRMYGAPIIFSPEGLGKPSARRERAASAVPAGRQEQSGFASCERSELNKR